MYHNIKLTETKVLRQQLNQILKQIKRGIVSASVEKYTYTARHDTETHFTLRIRTVVKS